MKFSEEKSEKAFTKLTGYENFPHYMGLSINRLPDEVLIALVCSPGIGLK